MYLCACACVCVRGCLCVSGWPQLPDIPKFDTFWEIFHTCHQETFFYRTRLDCSLFVCRLLAIVSRYNANALMYFWDQILEKDVFVFMHEREIGKCMNCSRSSFQSDSCSFYSYLASRWMHEIKRILECFQPTNDYSMILLGSISLMITFMFQPRD